jgi:REP-associated tyrosine transposase
LFEMRKRYRVDILDYIVTSNHVHLLLTARKGKNISDGLRHLHGRVAQFYNLENKKQGSFWSDRFHSTLIQDGQHLGKCLFYIDLQ